jgi:type II secretory pathway pseudopilin PulG
MGQRASQRRSNARPRGRGDLARARSRSRAGFTLLELLVVGILGTLVLVFIANAWRWYSRSVQSLQVSTQLTRELKLASEAIAQDFGPAVAARTVDGSQLQIDSDDSLVDGVAQWGAPDLVIEYAVEGTRLIRRDLNAATQLTLADHIAELSAETIGGKLQVRLTARYRGMDQIVTLQLEGS